MSNPFDAPVESTPYYISSPRSKGIQTRNDIEPRASSDPAIIAYLKIKDAEFYDVDIGQSIAEMELCEGLLKIVYGASQKTAIYSSVMKMVTTYQNLVRLMTSNVGYMTDACTIALKHHEKAFMTAKKAGTKTKGIGSPTDVQKICKEIGKSKDNATDMVKFSTQIYDKTAEMSELASNTLVAAAEQIVKEKTALAAINKDMDTWKAEQMTLEVETKMLKEQIDESKAIIAKQQKKRTANHNYTLAANLMNSIGGSAVAVGASVVRTGGIQKITAKKPSKLPLQKTDPKTGAVIPETPEMAAKRTEIETKNAALAKTDVQIAVDKKTIEELEAIEEKTPYETERLAKLKKDVASNEAIAKGMEAGMKTLNDGLSKLTDIWDDESKRASMIEAREQEVRQRLAEQARKSRSQLAGTLQKIKDGAATQSYIEMQIACLQVCNQSTGKIKAAMESIKGYWNGVKLQCERLVSNVNAASDEDETDLSLLCEAIKISALGWLLIGKNMMIAHGRMKILDGNISAFMSNLQTGDKAIATAKVLIDKTLAENARVAAQEKLCLK